MAERMRSTETLLALLDAFGSSLDVIFPKKHFLAGISSGGSEPMLDDALLYVQPSHCMFLSLGRHPAKACKSSNTQLDSQSE